VSRFTADKVVTLLRSSGYEVPEIEVMHARVDLDRYSPVAGNEQARQRLRLPGGPLLLHLGRLVKRKGVDRAIKAMPAITHMVPGATLLVAGTGPEEGTLRRVAARHRAPVRFLGRVDERDVPALYAQADAFILPVADRWFGLEVEGLGVVLLEAQACGTPCVTGHSGGTPEAVIDGATGFVVDGRDQGALVDAIVRLLRDGDLRTRMGRAGRAHVEKHFGGRELPRSLLGWLQASHQ
jgi:phosphatidylinositol alpha-1,6-mannosyltransferase